LFQLVVQASHWCWTSRRFIWMFGKCFRSLADRNQTRPSVSGWALIPGHHSHMTWTGLVTGHTGSLMDQIGLVRASCAPFGSQNEDCQLMCLLWVTCRATTCGLWCERVSRCVEDGLSERLLRCWFHSPCQHGCRCIANGGAFNSVSADYDGVIRMTLENPDPIRRGF